MSYAIIPRNIQTRETPNYGEFLTPDAQQYYQENMGAIAAQRKVVPTAIQAEQELLPTLQQYQRQLYGSQVQNLSGIYNAYQNQGIENQSIYGNQLLGMYGQMGSGATNAAVGSLSPWAQDTYNTFGKQAASDLALGSSLNEQETNQAQQAARAAAQARGLNFSRQGTDMEVLNTYNMGQKRLAQRRETATNAYQMAAGQQNYGAQAFLAPSMQTSSIYSTPSIFGAAQGSFQQMGSQFLQPESQYLANVRANRIQMQNANAAASAQRDAGTAGAIGTIAGMAMLAFCWVAREVYGQENQKWLEFRSWMFTESPDWFFKLYSEEGETYAKFISDKPILKKTTKFAMDTILSFNKIKLS